MSSPRKRGSCNGYAPAVPATIEVMYLVTIVFADSRVNILLAGVRAIRINASRVPKADPRIMRARDDLRPGTDPHPIKFLN